MNANAPAASRPAQQPKLLAYERTDVGRVRDHNEDSRHVDPAGLFFVVADGMGGHAAGEVASYLAVEEVKLRLDEARTMLESLGSDPQTLVRPIMTDLLKRVGGKANEAVRKRASEDPSTHGMGTTLEIACITSDGLWIGHVGDSRTYLVRSNAVSQLTTDHTVAQQLSKDKRVEMAEVLEQWGSVLVEAVGAKDDVNVEVVHCPLETGDRLLLCSDGLYEYFPRSEEIGEVLAIEGSEAGLERLVDLAFERGGKDNITGVLVEVLDAPERVVPTADAGVEFDSTVEGLAPVRTGVAQDYSIDEAIALMRKLPTENVEVVVKVVKRTLKSANVEVVPIITDAAAKQGRIKRRVDMLNKQVSGLAEEIAEFQNEIAELEADRAETEMVKERLILAEKMGEASK